MSRKRKTRKNIAKIGPIPCTQCDGRVWLRMWDDKPSRVVCDRCGTEWTYLHVQLCWPYGSIARLGRVGDEAMIIPAVRFYRNGHELKTGLRLRGKALVLDQSPILFQ